VYETVTATFDCGGQTFTAKDKRVIDEGWREIDRLFRSVLKEKQTDGDDPGGNPIGAIWGRVGYTVLLCFCLLKTGTIARSIFSAR
jgi:DNA topoisomerase-3